MEGKSADFGTYTLEDFIDDPQFILWVTQPTEELEAFWQQVQDRYPQTKAVLTDASKIVLSLQFTINHMNQPEQQALWETIEAKMQLPQKATYRLSFWLRTVAALFIFGLLSLSLFLYTERQEILVNTTFGQIKTVTLPDGSVVTINANSKLHYPKNWDKNNIREVWIEGEAFFKVNHLHQSGKIKASDRFIVHAEKLNVEVLGTSFNVNNRRGLVKVALLTGRVGLKVKDIANSEVKLQPGELGLYQEKSPAIAKKKVDVQDYALWKSGKLHFNNTPLREILTLIEDNYGYTAIVKDPSMAERKLSGTFLFSSEDALFKAISTALNISIQKDQVNHQLIIQ